MDESYITPVAVVSIPPARQPLLVKAADLAKLLSVTERQIWRWKSSGKLPKPMKIGRSTRWRLSEIEEWILSNDNI